MAFILIIVCIGIVKQVYNCGNQQFSTSHRASLFSSASPRKIGLLSGNRNLADSSMVYFNCKLLLIINVYKLNSKMFFFVPAGMKCKQ